MTGPTYSLTLIYAGGIRGPVLAGWTLREINDHVLPRLRLDPGLRAELRDETGRLYVLRAPSGLRHVSGPLADAMKSLSPAATTPSGPTATGAEEHPAPVASFSMEA